LLLLLTDPICAQDCLGRLRLHHGIDHTHISNGHVFGGHLALANLAKFGSTFSPIPFNQLKEFFQHNILELPAEEDRSNIPTIYHAMWLAIVTMTTVGYGDYFPTSLVAWGQKDLVRVAPNREGIKKHKLFTGYI